MRVMFLGEMNVVADDLSRPSVISVSAAFIGVDYPAMAADQRAPDIQAHSTSALSSQLENVPVGPIKAMLLCYVSTCVPRPLVYDAVHSLAHSSIRST